MKYHKNSPPRVYHLLVEQMPFAVNKTMQDLAHAFPNTLETLTKVAALNAYLIPIAFPTKPASEINARILAPAPVDKTPNAKS